MASRKVDVQVINAMAEVLASVDTSDTIDRPRAKILELHDLLKSRGYSENTSWTEAVKRALNV